MSYNEENTEEQSVSTYCYSFEVKMLIQVLANNDEHANAILDGSGGYISRREVKLVKTTLVADEKEE
jgi:hypothetical protein